MKDPSAENDCLQDSAASSIPSPNRAISGDSSLRPHTISLPSNFPRTIDVENSLKNIRKILESGFTDTEAIESLQSAVSSRLKRKHALLLGNGSSACHAALWALGIGARDEVICPALSDYATVFSVLACGATPVFADSDPLNGLISPEDIRQKLSGRTRAIMAVHFWGITCDMNSILSIAEDAAVAVVEDCCQAPFARYNGQHTGELGDISVFSLSKEKHWAADCGGLLVTDDDAIAVRAQQFGIARGSYWQDGYGRIHEHLGYNYRPSVLAAAVAQAQYQHLDSVIDARRRIITRLNSVICEIPGASLPVIPSGGENVAWMYHFRLDSRMYQDLPNIVQHLRGMGLTDIDTAYYYYLPESCAGALAQARVPEKLRFTNVCPNAYEYIRQTLRWVFTEKYSERNVNDVGQIISTYLNTIRGSTPDAE